MRKITEVITDHIDDNNLQHIDCYFDNNSESEGTTIAVVDLDTNKVIYYNNEFRFDSLVTQAITNITSKNKGNIGKKIIDNSVFIELCCDLATRTTEATFGEGTFVGIAEDDIKFSDDAQDFFNEEYDEIEGLLNKLGNIYPNNQNS